MSPLLILKNNLKKSIAAKQSFLKEENQFIIFEQAANAVLRAYQNGGRLYIAGNGGSAADAQHLAAEFVSKLSRDRAPLAAEALTVDTSILTAIGNDYGFDKVFSRQVQGKMRSNDIFLGITTSGNSKNILKAVETCNELNIPTIIFSGKGGGPVASLATYCIVAGGLETSTIQEMHIVFSHTLCEYIENAIFN